MTRLSKDDVIEKLKAKGFTENSSREFEENKYCFNESKTVMELLICGRKIQVGFIKDIDPETLIKQGDITMNCCAFDLKTRKMINLEMINDILEKKLKFCSNQLAKNDPWKTLSALKQISRIPNITIDNETLSIIKSNIPVFIDFFANNPEEQSELQNVFGNINSRQVLDLFSSIDTKGIFDNIDFVKSKLEVCDRYISIKIEDLTTEMKQEIADLVKKSFGRRFDPKKLFGNKINSVIYSIDNNGDINSCVLLSGERIYAIASKDADSIVGLLTIYANIIIIYGVPYQYQVNIL